MIHSLLDLLKPSWITYTAKYYNMSGLWSALPDSDHIYSNDIFGYSITRKNNNGMDMIYPRKITGASVQRIQLTTSELPNQASIPHGDDWRWIYILNKLRFQKFTYYSKKIHQSTAKSMVPRYRHYTAKHK